MLTLNLPFLNEIPDNPPSIFGTVHYHFKRYKDKWGVGQPTV